MVLNQINIRCKQLIVRCWFTPSCCPEDHCQTFLSWPSFLAHPLYTLFVNSILVNLESTILFSLIRFGKKSWLLALLLKRKSCLISLEINRSFKLSSTSRLCYSHSVAKKAFFSILHTLPLKIWDFWATLRIREALNFTYIVCACFCHAIHRSFKSFAEHSAHFIFTILHSRKIFMRTGHSGHCNITWNPFE